MLVDENMGELIFYNKVGEGSADKSYGIHVAQMAGIPKPLIENAILKLIELESESEPKVNKTKKVPKLRIPEVLEIEKVPHQIKTLIAEIDLNNTTPFEALSILEKLKTLNT